MKRAHIVALVAGALLVASAGAAQLQRRGGRFGYGQIRENPPYDGAFQFCRIMFRNASNGDGGGWAVDYPKADQNLSYRFSELTTTSVSGDGAGNFNHAVIRLTDEVLASAASFAPVYRTLVAGTMAAIDEAPGLVILRPTVVRVSAESEGTVAELAQVQLGKNGKVTLEAEPGSRFVRS